MTDALSRIQAALERMSKLEKAATEGPWEAKVGSYEKRFWIDGTEHSDGACVAIFNRSEADFIAATRTDQPRLVKALEISLKALNNVDSPDYEDHILEMVADILDGKLEDLGDTSK